jgi:polyisoprenyl-phosphate glycosyltransferase
MVSVVIPAFNEAEAIPYVVARANSALSDIEHEVVVVDDGSSDKTTEFACVAGARAVRHPHNLGYGAALKSGIKAAKYDTIVIADADGTYPLEQVPVLLAEYAKGFDMIVGARTGAEYRESVFKSPMRIWLKWLVEFTAGRTIPDINSGLRVFSRKTVLPYFDHLCNTFSFTTSLTLAYMMTSKFVGYVPIPYYKRIGKTKVRLVRDSLRTLQYITQAIVYYNPLKLFLLICGLILIVSLGSLVLATLFHWVSAFYLGIGGILMSVQVFCLGLLAELLRQIMAKE